MKEPIEPSEIRAGDTIERHWLGTVTKMPIARITQHDTHAYSPEGYCMGLAQENGALFFLIDRPKPAVELPTEPTLGWLDFTASNGGQAHALATWRVATVGMDGSTHAVNEWGHMVSDIDEKVTAFTPATAAPTDALEDLRAVVGRANRRGQDVTARTVTAFLAAVDEANGRT